MPGVDEIEARHKAYYDGEMADRATRPLDPERVARRDVFVAHLHDVGATSVVEVGCGAGRDGVALAAAGLAYVGVDLSSSAVTVCRELGLEALEGSALDLPLADDSVDAAWSMSTLMHLPGDGMERALGEIRRVVRPGGVAEVGVWGGHDRPRTDEHGRYFHGRSDDTLLALLREFGEVEDFATWFFLEDGAHYQWARLRLR